jgi:uncharacterized protein (TIGR02145 family)
VKKLLTLFGIFCALNSNAQDYLINFIGTNAPINIVQVENLTTGEILSLRGSDVLHLNNVMTGINDIDKTIVGMKIYPNPAINNSTTIKFNVPVPGDATISIYNIKGEKIILLHDYLNNSLQEYRLSNIDKGFYVVNVKNINYQLTGKIVCSGVSGGVMHIERLSNNQTIEYKNTSMEKQTSVTRSLEVDGTVEMLYLPGNRLKFTAISGEYRTTATDIPTQTKTITFDINPVIDKDNNNYHVVEIGDQSWLEENMKTTRYRDGVLIPLVTDSTKWSTLSSDAYSWYNNKITFKDPYGALYNGFAVGTGRICPIGWHIPSLDEWTALGDYLIFNNYDYSKEIQRSVGKSVASKTLWNVPQPLYMGHGTYLYPSPSEVGLNPQNNNSSGFNGFPGGSRWPNGKYDEMGKSAYWTGAGLNYESPYFVGGGGSRPGVWSGSDYKEGVSVRCIKGETKTSPVIVTNNTYNITQTSAYVTVSILGVGDSPIASKGVCWCEYDSTRKNFPTIDDYKTIDGSGTASFISIMTELKPGTLYYIRSYSINDEGITYGNHQTITTDIADADGNIYKTFVPSWSNSIWMTQNLKTTRFNDNTLISIVTDNARWVALKIPAPPHIPGVCWYNNDIANKNIYGGLYNWFAVNTGKLCPIGWHVSTDEDWTALEYQDGGDLKEIGTTHWQTPNVTTSQVNDFAALPGGKRDATGNFIDIGYDGFWWTSTEQWITTAWHRHMTNDVINLYKAYSDESEGLSVRCVKKVY